MPCLLVCTESDEFMDAAQGICERIGWEVLPGFASAEGASSRAAPKADATLFDLRHASKETEQLVETVAGTQPFLPLVFVSEDGLTSPELGSGLRYHIDIAHLDDLEHILISLSCSFASDDENSAVRDESDGFVPRILVVDDNPQLASLIVRTLRSMERFDVEVAHSGVEAGAILTGFRPDIAIIDMVLADMDGRDLCEFIRTQDRLKNTKIIAISGYLTEERLDADKVGFDVFIEKPFRMQELVESVTALLS